MLLLLERKLKSSARERKGNLGVEHLSYLAAKERKRRKGVVRGGTDDEVVGSGTDFLAAKRSKNTKG